jgi:hypothetical protein
VAKVEASCPHCGYCPHCGRSHTPTPYPYPYIPYPVYVMPAPVYINPSPWSSVSPVAPAITYLTT